MTLAAPAVERRTGFSRGADQSDGRMPLRTAAGLGLGAAVLWLSLLVLLPSAAVVVKATGNGWSGFWNALTTREALSAIRLTVFSSLGVAAVNAVIGTLIAWVLVRDSFRGKRVVEVVIDIPFALPTIVAGLVLLTLYGPHSPVGVNWYATTRGVMLALLFVTLPFVVRTVQPVLIALDREVEEAAASLGASRFTTFRRIILPAILPAIAGAPHWRSPGRWANTARWCLSRAGCSSRQRSRRCTCTARSRMMSSPRRRRRRPRSLPSASS